MLSVRAWHARAYSRPCYSDWRFYLSARRLVRTDLRRARCHSTAGSLVLTDRVRTRVCSGLQCRARRVVRPPHRGLTSVPPKLGENVRSKTITRYLGRCERAPQCDRPGRRLDSVLLLPDSRRETIANPDALHGSPWCDAPRIDRNSILADRSRVPLRRRSQPTQTSGPLASGGS